MKKKLFKDYVVNIIHHLLNTAINDIFFQSITIDEIFPKFKFIANQEQLNKF